MPNFDNHSMKMFCKLNILHWSGMKEKSVKSETDSEGFYLLDFLGFKSLVEPSESKSKGWVGERVLYLVYSMWCDYEVIIDSLSFLRIRTSISLHLVICHVVPCLYTPRLPFSPAVSPCLPSSSPSLAPFLPRPLYFTITIYPFLPPSLVSPYHLLPYLSFLPPPLFLLLISFLISPSHLQTPSD